MTQLETIWNRAKAALMLTGARGEDDQFLWEHTERLGKTALAISEFPEISSPSVDQTAVLAAALFQDGSWALRSRSGECTRAELLTRPLSSAQRDMGIALLEKVLLDVMAPLLLDRAVRAIRQSPDRSTTLVEARILADAVNLDEMSLFSLWPGIRRGAQEGKGVQSVLDHWHRRKEYQYWSSRIKEGFHFASCREIAVRRLADYERLMEQLQHQHTVADLTPSAGVMIGRIDASMPTAKVG